MHPELQLSIISTTVQSLNTCSFWKSVQLPEDLYLCALHSSLQWTWNHLLNKVWNTLGLCKPIPPVHKQEWLINYTKLPSSTKSEEYISTKICNRCHLIYFKDLKLNGLERRKPCKSGVGHHLLWRAKLLSPLDFVVWMSWCPLHSVLEIQMFLLALQMAARAPAILQGKWERHIKIRTCSFSSSFSRIICKNLENQFSIHSKIREWKFLQSWICNHRDHQELIEGTAKDNAWYSTVDSSGFLLKISKETVC